MKIAVLGAGKVGGTLAARFATAGHEVAFAVRRPEDPKYAGTTLPLRPIAEAARDADIIVLATPWASAEDALRAGGDFGGRILIDATNPIGPGGVLTHGRDDSGAEQVARWAPSAKVVKAFNTIGREVMANPAFGDRRAVLWICGDDAVATATVSSLAQSIGFEPIILGGLAKARSMEPAASLWITSAGVLGSREFAWGVLRR